MISTYCGSPVSSLGLAAHPNQDPRCVRRAFESGINYFFFYGPGNKSFIEGLQPLLRQHRAEIVVASGSGARKRQTLRAARRKILAAVGADMIDVFFAEYIHPGDDPDSVFGDAGVLDQLQQWKAEGAIRYVGATAHDRGIAKQLAQDPRVDVLMHRFNMAHRKAASEVFPDAIQAKTPIVAFTATRWGTLLKGHPKWNGDRPSAADCYRFCLSESAVQVVLTAPESVEELKKNVSVIDSARMSDQDRARWEQFGDVIYNDKGAADDYESRWP